MLTFFANQNSTVSSVKQCYGSGSARNRWIRIIVKKLIYFMKIILVKDVDILNLSQIHNRIWIHIKMIRIRNTALQETGTSAQEMYSTLKSPTHTHLKEDKREEKKVWETGCI